MTIWSKIIHLYYRNDRLSTTLHYMYMHTLFLSIHVVHVLKSEADIDAEPKIFRRQSSEILSYFVQLSRLNSDLVSALNSIEMGMEGEGINHLIIEIIVVNNYKIEISLRCLKQFCEADKTRPKSLLFFSCVRLAAMTSAWVTKTVPTFFLIFNNHNQPPTTEFVRS